jgi:capsid protein
MVARKTTRKSPAVPAKATEFDYDAVKTTNRRRKPSERIRAEHVILPDSKRKKLLSTVQDQIRNSSLAAWSIRRHLDYVSKFKFQFRSGNDALDALVERIFYWHAQPRNFDVAERFGREEMFRHFEMEKVAAGDAAMIKTSDLRLQAIESDLIAYPNASTMPEEYRSIVDRDTGVVMDPARPGRIDKFCICNRGKSGSEVAFDHLEDATNVIFDAYYTRFSSQVRGVSPLSSAINSIQDVYEGVDFNLAKAKIHAIFGIALMRDYAGATTDQEEVFDFGGASGITTGATEASAGAVATEAGTKQIESTVQEMKPNEMLMVDMDTRGRIDTIESRTPSAEFKDFTEFVIRLSFLALDIPYSAFDSRSSSFSSMIADQNLYEIACKWKREKNLWKRREYSDWLLEQLWNNEEDEWGLRQIATRAGVTRLRMLQEMVEWVPAGFPWLQKLQEVQGDIKAVSCGLDNPIDICKRRGTDFFMNIEKTAEAYAYAKSLGVPLMIGEPGQASIAQVEKTAAEAEEIPAND